MRPFIFIVSSIVFLFACKYDKTNSQNPRVDTSNTSNSNQSLLSAFAKDTQFILISGLITLPKGWRLANDDTLPKVADATVRYRFHNKSGKLIKLQYGLGTIGNPAEPNVVSNRFRKGYIANNVDTSDIIFTDNPYLSEFRKKSGYSFSLEKISSLQATFFRPKQIGNGYIGIYIDSIGQIAGNIADLVLYAEGLDSLESKELEKVNRSLVIKDFK